MSVIDSDTHADPIRLQRTAPDSALYQPVGPGLTVEVEHTAGRHTSATVTRLRHDP